MSQRKPYRDTCGVPRDSTTRYGGARQRTKADMVADWLSVPVGGKLPDEKADRGCISLRG